MEPEAPNYDLTAEAIVAVTGIFPTKPITPDDAEKARELPKKLAAGVERFCRFGDFASFKMPPGLGDLEECFQKLNPLTEEETAIATTGWANPELISAWSFTVNAARSYLKEHFPVIIRETPTGPEWCPPPTSEKGRLTSTYAVVNAPTWLLDDMNRGAMTPEQVHAVKAVYPQIFQRLLGSFDIALREAGAKSKHCPWKHEMQLRVLFEKPPTGLLSFGSDSAKRQAENLGNAPVALNFDGLRTKAQALR